MIRRGTFLLLTIFCTVESRYIPVIRTLSELRQCLFAAEKPVWITAVSGVLLNKKTGKTMEPETVKYFNEIQKEVRGSIGIVSTRTEDVSSASEQLLQNGIAFNDEEVQHVNFKYKHLHLSDGIFSGDLSRQSLISFLLMALHNSGPFNVYDSMSPYIEEALITVAHEHEATAISSFLAGNYFPIDCTVVKCDFLKQKDTDEATQEEKDNFLKAISGC